MYEDMFDSMAYLKGVEATAQVAEGYPDKRT